jgi:hypothetical protein
MSTIHRIPAALVFAFALVATAAQAQYRCDAPQRPVDRRACEAAKESPDTLRRYIQRMAAIESLQFSDYVNDATVLAWQARERSQQQAGKAEDKALASSKR